MDTINSRLTLRIIGKTLCCFCLVLFCALPAMGQSGGDSATISKIEAVSDLPGDYQLSNPYPNPFNPTTNIRVAVKEAQNVSMSLHDMLGRQVKALYNGELSANREYTFRIEGASLKSGVYLIKIVGRDFSTSRTVALIK